jgi:hypothetical protein
MAGLRPGHPRLGGKTWMLATGTGMLPCHDANIELDPVFRWTRKISLHPAVAGLVIGTGLVAVTGDRTFPDALAELHTSLTDR